MNKIGRSEPIPYVHIYPYDSFLKEKKTFSGVKKKSCVGLSHLSLFEFFFVEDNPLRCFWCSSANQYWTTPFTVQTCACYLHPIDSHRLIIYDKNINFWVFVCFKLLTHPSSKKTRDKQSATSPKAFGTIFYA